MFYAVENNFVGDFGSSIILMAFSYLLDGWIFLFNRDELKSWFSACA